MVYFCIGSTLKEAHIQDELKATKVGSLQITAVGVPTAETSEGFLVVPVQLENGSFRLMARRSPTLPFFPLKIDLTSEKTHSADEIFENASCMPQVTMISRHFETDLEIQVWNTEQTGFLIIKTIEISENQFQKTDIYEIKPVRYRRQSS